MEKPKLRCNEKPTGSRKKTGQQGKSGIDFGTLEETILTESPGRIQILAVNLIRNGRIAIRPTVSRADPADSGMEIQGMQLSKSDIRKETGRWIFEIVCADGCWIC